MLTLTLVFAPLSLLSIGGGASLLAEIEHQSVGVHAWTTEREFANLFAISRAAPGPGTMLSTLIGWKVAGLAGALTATIALYLPIAGFTRRTRRLARSNRCDGRDLVAAAPSSAGVVLRRRGVVRPRRGARFVVT
ncbi:MAG: chromate transporter [Alphaproteobacteria bacterium]|nr:MAG: chromate transporter [Alphaproteobacteria bacterium]